ncbi:hypothetical protein [Acinetobacter phage AB1I1M-1]
MNIGDIFTFTKNFFDNESDGLLKYYPEISPDKKYEIQNFINLEGFNGATKISCVDDGSVFSIYELNRLPESQRPENLWWCFISDQFSNEYEVLDGNTN